MKADVNAKRAGGGSARKPPKAKVQAKRLVARKAPKRKGSTERESEKRLAEALERQAATSEILRVISQSPRELEPIFETIVQSAVRLCEARYGAVFRMDRGLVHLAAHHNISETLLAQWFQTFYPMAPNLGHVSGRAILTGATVQVPDMFTDDEYRGTGMKKSRRTQRAAGGPGIRSTVGPSSHGEAS